ENKIKVLGSPLANDEKTPKADWDKDTEFTFYFDMACQPEFELNLSKHKADLYDIEPTQQMLDKFIEDQRMRFGKVESPETIGEKDMVYGHLVQLGEDGTPLENGIDTKTTMYVERIALATVKKQFIGKKKDSVITFKPAKALKDANHLASFLRKSTEEAKEFNSDAQFTVETIQRMTPAEMNEEFFSRVYADKNIKDEASFTQACKDELCKAYAREADTYFLNKASEELVKSIKMELPEEFLKRWLKATANSEDDAKKIEDNFDKYLDGIRWQMIEGEIAQKYGIKVGDDDIINYYKTELLPSYFPAMPDESEEQKKEREQHLDSVARNMLNEREQSKQVYNYLFDRKITDVLKQNMKVSQKKLNMDEFLKQISPAEATEKKPAKKRTAKAEKKTEEEQQPSLF
ncbi:MAG: hypothetical protein IJ250_07140, partial [Bacteroidales bacterium]|nr:hypothetical protein [Bacteroidales bacterium]